jgi:hypothetical protein
MPKSFKACPKNSQNKSLKCAQTTIGQKKSKRSPFDVARINFLKLKSRNSPPTSVCPKENVPKLSPNFTQPLFSFEKTSRNTKNIRLPGRKVSKVWPNTKKSENTK